MVCEGSSMLLFCSDQSLVRWWNHVSAVSLCFNTVSPSVVVHTVSTLHFLLNSGLTRA